MSYYTVFLTDGRMVTTKAYGPEEAFFKAAKKEGYKFDLENTFDIQEVVAKFSECVKSVELG